MAPAVANAAANALVEMDGRVMAPLLPPPSTLMVQVAVEMLPVKEIEPS
ncbi:hypothetical protein DLM_2729 [Aquitalea magnusonii]|uniref:Uncharacterized protein n=1 Tax=Aquitalea magnusonii TaxID=332411 RepID=A0A3G9GEN5_9NEIS|nr:hypothetical protein DLM_2729 [Aquitalea magnusonii]